MSDTDDVIDGNVGTEYDEIDQSTMYFDGVPPKWTYEKLKELYDKGELEGNIDVTSRGETLNEVYYDKKRKTFTFKREIRLTREFCYRITQEYFENGNITTDWELHDAIGTRAIFIADNQYSIPISEIREELKEFRETKLFKHFIKKRENND